MATLSVFIMAALCLLFLSRIIARTVCFAGAKPALALFDEPFAGFRVVLGHSHTVEVT